MCNKCLKHVCLNKKKFGVTIELSTKVTYLWF